MERPSIVFTPVDPNNFNFLRFLFVIIPVLFSSIFMFYIIKTISLQSVKLKSNLLISSKQKNSFHFSRCGWQRRRKRRDERIN